MVAYPLVSATTAAHMLYNGNDYIRREDLRGIGWAEEVRSCMNRCIRCRTSFGSSAWTCPSCGFRPETNGVLVFAPEFAGEHDGFDAVSFDLLPAAEDESFWFRSRSRLIIWAIRQGCSELSSFIEIGCGTGYVLRDVRSAFPAARLVAAEPFLAGLKVTRSRVSNAELLQVDARTLPFEAEFDAAGAFDVLEHIDEDRDVLSELNRALRPGGVLVVTVPQHRWLWGGARRLCTSQAPLQSPRAASEA